MGSSVQAAELADMVIETASDASSDASPAAVAGALDQAHLARMTFGDRKLEKEVLDLFERQACMLLGRMQDAAPAVITALAHTLNGSASGIGAWRVAGAAQELERVASGREQGNVAAATARLSAAVSVAQMAIAERRRAG